MARKCGFFDCNNQVEKGNSCQNCKDRKENEICSACRQPEPQEFEVLTFHPSLIKKKYLYKAATIIRDKLPIQLQTEFDQLLPQLKLTVSEQELITEAEKFISDFLAEKGGKQDHIDRFLFCSVCNPELNSRVEDVFEKNPQKKVLIESINKKEKKLENFFADKVRKAINEEELKKMGKEAEEEIYKQIAANPTDNQRPNQQGPGQQGPSQQPNQNDNNQEKITQLQQEINGLKQEIRDLKNPRNSTPPDPNKLQEKENKLREKEKELDKLNKNNNPSPNNQPSKNGNSNLPLYLGLGVMGIIIIFLIALLIISQKKKKNILKLTGK